MRRVLVIIGMVLLLGGWSCGQTGYTGSPGGQTGYSGHPPEPRCLREVYPPLCPVGENPG